MSEEYNPDIVTVMDEDGTEHVFEELDRIETEDGSRYVALLPLYDEAEEIIEADGELIILKVSEEDGEQYLSQIEDDDEFEEIGRIFEERLADIFEFNDDEEAIVAHLYILYSQMTGGERYDAETR